MGCGESKEDRSRYFTPILDPEEEGLHLKAWRDAAMRQRVLCLHEDTEDTAEVQCKKAVAFHSALMRQDQVSWDSGAVGEHEASTRPGANLNRIAAERAGDLSGSADTVEQSETAEVSKQQKLERVERDRAASERKCNLEVDPASWQVGGLPFQQPIA